MNTSSEWIFQIIWKRTFVVGESAPVAYGGDFVQFPDEKDLLRAHFLIELIEQYRYSLEQILVCVYLPTTNSGIDYAEVDLLVQDNSHKPLILCAVEPPQTYEQNLEDTMRRLFAMLLEMPKKSSAQFLIYYTRWYESKTRKTRRLVVDARKYPTFSAWHSAGRPSENDIPSNQT